MQGPEDKDSGQGQQGHWELVFRGSWSCGKSGAGLQVAAVWGARDWHCILRGARCGGKWCFLWPLRGG